MEESISAAIQAWAQGAGPAQLAAGPQPADLGGHRAVAAAASDLATSPWFVYLIDLAAHDAPPQDALDDTRERIDRAVIDGFAHHDRVSSYVSAATRLLTYPGLAQRLGRPLEVACLRRAEQGTTADADPGIAVIAATAAQTVLHLSTTGVFKPHRLLAFLNDLIDVVNALPAPLAARLPHIIGLAHEHFGDDDLLTLLQQLLTIPDAEADAAFELALADLRRALNASNQAVLIPALAQARRGFATVEAADEARHDAQAYGAAIDAIMAFQQSAPGPLTDAVARLETAVSQYHAWWGRMYSPPWNWGRAQAEAAWLQLSKSLSAAAQQMHAACWYHADQAIAALLDAYQAARSFTTYTEQPNGLKGVEVLVRPAVEGTFLRDANRLALLDHALAHDPELVTNEAAQRLHRAVHEALQQSSGAPTAPTEDGGGLGKALSRLTAVLTHFGLENTEELITSVPPQLLDRIEAILWNEEIAKAATGNVKVEQLLDRLHRELATSPDWIAEIAAPFKILLRQTVLYLDSRFDIGGMMGGDRTAFLRADPETETPKEKPLHQDYYEWLTQGPIYNIIKAEVINIGHGRADVLVHFANSSFCVECKRELDDASREALRTYTGQASAYTATDAALGILLVLDLTDHSTGAPDLFSSVWIEKVQRSPEEQPRYVVVARLPGNMPAPSDTSAPSPPTPPRH